MMKKNGWLWLLALTLFAACHEDKPQKEVHLSRQTMVIFMPWSTNMKPFFDINIVDFEKGLVDQGLIDDRVVVCIATSPSSFSMIELKIENGEVMRDTLKTTNNPDFTKSANITKMFSEVTQTAPAHHYSLIVGGHGMAWLPVATTSQHRVASQYFDYPSIPITRWFGGLTPDYQIDISTFAEGISSSGIHFDFILFDDCYMSNVEVAYQLSEVADFLIGCPTEIMAYGFPYHKCAKYLVGDMDFQRLCETFYDFYMAYEIPCGSVAVIDCRQLPKLVDIVRAMNTTFWESDISNKSIQRMDGYTEPLFYDLGDVYDQLCPDSSLLVVFHKQLNLTVPFKANTPNYYSAFSGFLGIRCFSGITTSTASTNPLASMLSTTSWYQATHY